MSNNNLPKQYEYNNDLKIWIRPDYQGMGYSDGDSIEDGLKQVIDQAEDVSVMSVELANQCVDWVSTYHLSRKRSNLLRPFEQQLQDRTVLEIGSGCGAITRYMGESGATVTALEGSPRRASITASRCRDLENVTVLSDNFSQFETEQRYDLVTLIGVLEYARSFVTGDDPISRMLNKAKNYLKPDGVLIIAIENQLGLKYFAGYPEDHLGKPMFGIEEHYGSDTAVTFGKQELSNKVATVGLTEQRWWYPFPDYKMPSLLVSEEGANKQGDFDLATLVRGACSSDAQTPNGVSFIQERAWIPVIKNGLLGDMANSFVLLASANKLLSYQTNDWAHHYASERLPGFAKHVVFESDGNEDVVARQLSLYPNENSDTETVNQVLQQESYIIGKSWHDRLVELMSTPGWSVESVADWWSTWWDALELYAKNEDLNLNDESVAPILLDAMPRNLFYKEDETFEFIDLEWQYFQTFSVDFLAFRALFSSFQSLGICAEPAKGTSIETAKLINSVLLCAGRIELPKLDLQKFIDLESDIQLATGGRRGFSWEQYQQSAIRVFDTLTPAFQRINTLQDQLFFKEKELLEYSNEKTHQIDQLQIEIKQHEQFKEMLLNSLSWKITKPIRFAKRLLSPSHPVYRKFRSPVQRIKSSLIVLKQLIEIAGGKKSAVARVIQLYRREGVTGVKRVLANILAKGNNYQDWIYHFDTLTDETRLQMRQRIEQISTPPLMSIVMPTYNPNPDWLIEAIESVQSQIYPHWELCIADDVSPDPKVRQILKDFANKDKRIKVVFREENGHISAASNSALEVAGGDWIVLMDHDDLIAEDALYWLADTIDRYPETRLIYSDEDKIDENGNRHLPYFKCDWNLDLFYSQNMFSHLGALETNLMRSVDGFRIGLEGSQDYDLVLRCMEKIEQDQIRHIPKVLYHWRVHQESTSSSNDAKPYVVQAGERALDEHFERTGVKAKSEFVGVGYRVHFALPDKIPTVHLCITAYEDEASLRRCLSRILSQTNYPDFHVSVISHKPQLSDIDKEDRIAWVNVGGSESIYDACNRVVEESSDEVVGFISSTVEVDQNDWLMEMVSQASRHDVGAVGAKLIYSDDTIKHGGMILGIGDTDSVGYAHHHLHKENNGYAGRLSLLSSFSVISTSCMLIRRSIFMEVGGFKPKRQNWHTWTNVDFCLSIKEAGYRNVLTPYAELYDHAKANDSKDSKEHDSIRQRWQKLLEYDPAYSQNLTLEREDFTYAWPPRVASF